MTPFYYPTGRRLDSFARYAAQFESFKDLSSRHKQMANDDTLAWIWDKEVLQELSENDLILWVAALFARGDVEGLDGIIIAFKMYQDGWSGLSNKDQAKIHLMTACNILWEEGRDRSQVTKQEVQLRALRLWAESVVRRRGLKVSEANVKREEKNLPHVDWPLIRRELGLDDLKESKPGRKPIGNKKGA